MVEAWFDHSMYVCNWFSGRCGTNNYKTIIFTSPLFREVFTGMYNFCLPKGYTTKENGIFIYVPYFLGDGIYPNWPLFAKPIHHPDNDEEALHQASRKYKEINRTVLRRVAGTYLCASYQELLLVQRKHISH